MTHTFELESVNNACSQLISDNAQHLIRYIYSHQQDYPYNDPKTRVGLVLKTLLKTGNEVATVKSDAIEPAIKDLTKLINESPSQSERNVYTDELKFLGSCTILDDLISLNTAPQA